MAEQQKPTAANEWSFEEIDKHIQQVDLKAFEAGGKQFFDAATARTAPADVLTKICAIYKVVRPILIAVSNLIIIPKKWRDAIKTFIKLMDQLCP
jgi:hypothetical protein